MSTPIEIIGMIGVNRERDASRGVTVSLFGGGINPANEIPAGIDPDYIAQFAQAHEQSGFDKTLLGYSSATADGFAVAAYAAQHTQKLGYLIAHRPGFMAPTLAARHAATLDQLSGGRIALHIISGGSDQEQRRDGDWLDHDSRYRRTAEWMDIVRRIWTEYAPFDYHGEFYRLEQAHSQVRTHQKPHIPLYFGGASEAAIETGAKYADVYALWGEPLDAIRRQIAEIRRRAARYQRTLRFSLSVRPILADTENEAWDRARSILDRIRNSINQTPPPNRQTADPNNPANQTANPHNPANQTANPNNPARQTADPNTPARQTAPPNNPAGETVGPRTPARPQSVGSRRLLDFAAQSEIHDQRLWMPIAATTGAAGSTTALVGTPDQVAESLLAYYQAGCTTILIRGFDPLQDTIQYGQKLIPTLRAQTPTP